MKKNASGKTRDRRHLADVSRTMKIVHLNTYDIKGGAAQATYRLHRGLRSLGCESLLLVAHRTSNDPSVIGIAPKMDVPSRLRRRVRSNQIVSEFVRYKATRPPGYEAFSDDRTVYSLDLMRQLPPCDVINLHWVAGLLDYRSFFSAVPSHVPIFWRLSDMNPLTGGCHFDDGCGKHSINCGACPQLGSGDPEDLSRQVWNRKAEVFKQLRADRLHFVALNRWMAELVARSPLFSKFQVSIIPNGVDTEEFAPRDRRAARDVLGIPQDGSVVAFVSDHVRNPRKGFALLAEALNQLGSFRNIFLLSVGHDPFTLQTQIRQCQVGHLENRRLLSLVYSAADLYVIPSLQDNQPNTALEAMACGTPVIGFNVGGIPDMVRPGVTGDLVPAGDVRALRDSILKTLSDPEKLRIMSASCRETVLREYPLEGQIRRYLEIYERSLANRESARTYA